MNGPDVRPPARRRAAAIASITLVAVVALATVGEITDEPVRVLIHLVLLALLVGGLWVALTRVATDRVIGIAIAVAAAIGIVVVLFGAEGALAASLAIRVGLIFVAVGLARYALGTTMRSLKAAEVSGTSVGPAAHRVQLKKMN